jgi:adenylate kinase
MRIYLGVDLVDCIFLSNLLDVCCFHKIILRKVDAMEKMFGLLALAVVLVFALSSCGVFSKKEQPQPTKTILTFLGAPGSGKGTVAEQCVRDLGYATMSTGNLLREAVARGDELGKKAESFMKEGKLVPDELVMSLVEDWLTRNMPKITTLVLDGYPRTEAQAKLFIDLLKNKFSDVTLRVVNIAISDNAIVARLADRLVCSNKPCQSVYSPKMLKDPTKLVCEKCGSPLIRREDDNETVVRNRLKVYADNVDPIIKVYKDSGVRFDELNVENKTVEEVFAEFKKLV